MQVETSSFTFFAKLSKACIDLGEDTGKDLAWAILKYGSTGKYTALEFPLNVMFDMVLADLDASRQAHQNGKRGGRPKKEDTQLTDVINSVDETQETIERKDEKEGVQTIKNPQDEQAQEGLKPTDKKGLKPLLETPFGKTKTLAYKDKDKEKNKDKDKYKDKDTERAGAPAVKRFKPPTVDEVRAYVSEKGYHFDAEAFVAFYASNGWRVGKNPMKDWHMACVTWEKRRAADHPQAKEAGDVYSKL